MKDETPDFLYRNYRFFTGDGIERGTRYLDSLEPV